MTERNRNYLVQEFKDGERPSGADFEDMFDSFLNKTDDGLSLDEDGNIQLSRGVSLGDSDANVSGTLRFHDNRVQYRSDTGWEDIASGSGGGGGFQPVEGSSDLVYESGNVGIGFSTLPTYRLEVNLGRNTGESERVRFGNVICSNGPSLGTAGYAYFYNSDDRVSDNVNSNYALRQSPEGEVHINAPLNIPLSFRQNGTTIRLGIAANGNVIVGGGNNIDDDNYRFQVNGAAFKSEGGGEWNILSDARVKEDIHDLDAGLDELMKVRPVRFRYNGKGGTRRGVEGVGIIGQEIEEVFPDMVHRVAGNEKSDLENLLTYNGSNLKYVLINAVKQLAVQVQELKQELKESQKRFDNHAG